MNGVALFDGVSCRLLWSSDYIGSPDDYLGRTSWEDAPDDETREVIHAAFREAQTTGRASYTVNYPIGGRAICWFIRLHMAPSESRIVSVWRAMPAGWHLLTDSELVAIRSLVDPSEATGADSTRRTHLRRAMSKLRLRTLADLRGIAILIN